MTTHRLLNAIANILLVIGVMLVLAACGPDSNDESITTLSTEDRLAHAAGVPRHALAMLRVVQPRALAYSPSGERLALSSGSRLAIYSADLSAAQVLEGHTDSIRGLAWSPDGAQIASASLDRTVRVWDAVSGEARLTLSGHDDWVLSVAWSADGALLISGGTDGTLRAWDAATGDGVWMVGADEGGGVTALIVDPMGHRLASGSSSGAVRLWDAANGDSLGTLRQHKEGITSLDWSADGQWLASGSWDTSLVVWDIANEVARHTLTHHTEAVTAVEWSPDGTRIASASRDNSIRLWNALEGKEIATLAGHTAEAYALTWSPDGSQLASIGLDNSLRLWDVGTMLAGGPARVATLAWSPTGAPLAAGSADGTLRLWDVDSATATSLIESDDPLRAAAWSPDGTKLATGGEQGVVRLWDATNGESLAEMGEPGQWVTAVAWSPDGTRLASGGWDQALHLWDAASGEELLVVPDLPGAVSNLAWSPDGTQIAVSTQIEHAVVIVDTGSGALLRSLPTAWGGAVAWSPDGSRIAISDRLTRTLVAESTPTVLSVNLWDMLRADLPINGGIVIEPLDDEAEIRQRGSIVTVTQGDRQVMLAERESRIDVDLWGGALTLHIERGQGQPVVTPEIKPGSPITRSWEGGLSQTALGSSVQVQVGENLVTVWSASVDDAAADTPLLILPNHTSWVTALAWSPDGAQIASGSTDQTVYLWDATTGETLSVLQGAGDAITGLAWSPASAAKTAQIAAAAGNIVWIWGGR